LNILDAKRVANDIKNFKVQGANQIALYSLEFLKQYVTKNEFDSKFFQVIDILENARPTAVVLHNCLE
jgi:translation initiation factor 2B subunit (eIF-2B alpha/beta/delta family)